MLRNLIDNALRHTMRGGITLGAATCLDPENDSRTLLCLSVADTGGGIAAEHHRRIFDEHYQIGNESRQRTSGLGLGLAIVRRIAALHDVAVCIESVPGEGSRFTLRFRSSAHRPNREPARPAPAAITRVRPPRFSGQRLLLIEDDETLGKAFLAWFEAAGFQASLAADAAQGRRMLESGERLHVVVSDFRLPGELDGLALLDLAGERHPAACRILISGDIDSSLAQRAARQGVPLLCKPVDPSLLQSVLAANLSGTRHPDC
jgi:CheY-like chemotaxis protein